MAPPADNQTRISSSLPDEEPPGNALAIGSRIAEFEITGIVGEGGFGIVYLAYDHSLERSVALKEYMPSSLAARVPGSADVRIKTQRHAETFKAGLRSFVNEAKVLAQFDHPALVKVYRFWEENGTAYMVMPYYQGVTLKDWLRERVDPPDEATLKRLLGPVLEALDVIHRAQIYHRDIAPDNILLLEGERPLLLDFGAARRVIGDMTQALTVILKPGYAPIEQYAEVPGMKQGAFTDIYALGALIYYAIIGRTPPPSVARMVNDGMEPLVKQAAGRYSAQFLEGVDRCLAVRQEDRPQSIREMWGLLGIEAEQFTQVMPSATTDDERARHLEEVNKASRSPLPAIFGALALVSAAGAAWYLAGRTPPDNDGHAKPPVVTTIASVATETVSPAATSPAVPPASEAPLAPMPPAEREPAQPPATAVTVAPPAEPPPEESRPAETRPAETRPAEPPEDNLPPEVEVPDPVTFLQAAFQARDRARRVAVEVNRTRVHIGRDKPSFRVRSSDSGYLYVFMVGTDSEHLIVLFPNAIDSDNRISAGTMLTLPRSGWSFVAGGPAGTNHLLAMVSDAPRDFASGGVEHGDPFDEFPLHRIAELSGQRGGERAFIVGEADCRGTSACSQAYGATLFSIEEIE